MEMRTSLERELILREKELGDGRYPSISTGHFGTPTKRN
jgi:hypothetical protein